MQNFKTPPLFNRIMIRLLCSPLHALWSPMHGSLSKSVMLITFTGRKSGRVYTTPVSYVRDGNKVTAFTHSPWVCNLRDGAPVTLRLQGQDVRGTAQVISDDLSVVAQGLMDFLGRVPRDAQFYGIALDANKHPDPADVARVARQVSMIHVYLN